MVLVLAKCGKINNVQAVESVVIAVLKKAVPAVKKKKAMTAVMRKLSQLSGKAVTAIMKKLSQLSGKVVCFGQKSMRSNACFQIAGKVISTFTL